MQKKNRCHYFFLGICLISCYFFNKTLPMNNFDKQNFNDLEKLCRIKCSPEEEISLLEDFQKILNFVEQLKEVDTEGVETRSFILQDLLQNVFRTDEETKTMPTDLFLSNAPDQVAGMVKVPSILK